MKHKIDHPVDVLPESLGRAVRAFIVARAIRNTIRMREMFGEEEFEEEALGDPE